MERTFKGLPGKPYQGQIHGILTEGEVSVQLTSFHEVVWNSCFNAEKYFLLFNKTSYLNEEVKCTEPSIIVRVP
jgi:hypothetical protein